jgi:predicted nucleotidyltransferase
VVNEDYRDILIALVEQGARFLVVGAHAMAAHGYPRATVDIDLWIEPTPENAERVWRALAAFGAPLDALDVSRGDFVRHDMVIQFGLPPNRVDILTGVSGLEFVEAWANRVDAVVDGVRVPVISLSDLIENKRATGRDKDRSDIKGLNGES